MKIAYIYDLIYPFTKGGAELRFWELAKRLAANGHEVHIIGMKFWSGECVINNEGVYLHGICKPLGLYTEKTGRRSILEALHFTWMASFFLYKNHYDVIDVNAFPYLPIFPIRIISRLKNIALVVTWQEVWGAYWIKYLGYIKGFFGYLIERAAIDISPLIIFHASCVGKALQRYGAKEKNICFIPDGADINRVNSINNYKESSDIIFVGRLIKHKNVGLIINTVQVLKEKIPHLKCLIIGGGPEQEKLVADAKNKGLLNNIIFKGIVENYDDVLAYLKASKIFIFPSSREGFGIAVIEAMACGLPVVTVKENLNAATELIEEGKNGFICLPNPDSIAGIVISLLANEKLRGEMSENAKAFAQAYSWDIIARQNEKIYRRAIQKESK